MKEVSLLLRAFLAGLFERSRSYKRAQAHSFGCGSRRNVPVFCFCVVGGRSFPNRNCQSAAPEDSSFFWHRLILTRLQARFVYKGGAPRHGAKMPSGKVNLPGGFAGFRVVGAPLID
jgi:hypothetical protein